jgi:hypothetical protein
MKAGSVAVGAKLDMATDVAYFPQVADDALRAVAESSFGLVLGDANVNGRPLALGASSDLGDLGLLMPVIQPRIGGVVGDPHTADYRVVDYDLAVIASAKAMAVMAITLLRDGAVCAERAIAARAADRRSREGYLALRSELEAS